MLLLMKLMQMLGSGPILGRSFHFLFYSILCSLSHSLTLSHSHSLYLAFCCFWLLNIWFRFRVAYLYIYLSKYTVFQLYKFNLLLCSWTLIFVNMLCCLEITSWCSVLLSSLSAPLFSILITFLTFTLFFDT